MTKRLARQHLRKGPAPKTPPADCASRILTLAADGFSVRGVAAGLNTSADVLRRWMKDDPELAEAFEQGREQERHTLHNMLYRQATEKGNATAAMFLLKARHGYREGEITEASSRVNIVLNLPAATPLAEFRVIEHG